MKASKELLYKFSEGRCSPGEIKVIEEWLMDGEWILDNGEEVPVEIKNSIWKKLSAEINFSSKAVKMSRRFQLMKIAAVFIIAAGITLFFYFHKNNISSSQQVYITSAQEHKRIMLSDSSVIFMSPNSTIRVMQPFPENKRDIELSGEAFFEVAKDASRPFTVITNNIRTTALGTSFKVTSFPDKNSINVALSYGKVLVQNQHANTKTDSFYLTPGETIHYDKINHSIEKTKPSRKQFNYKKDILYFKEAGVKEVADKLEEFYNVKVAYSSLRKADWRVSGEFDYQPLDIVMKNISFSCNISYQIKADSVILKPNKNNEE